MFCRRTDKFHHHKIDKLMKMMGDRTKKRRAKSAPANRTVPVPEYDINNLPSTIHEHKVVRTIPAPFPSITSTTSPQLYTNIMGYEINMTWYWFY